MATDIAINVMPHNNGRQKGKEVVGDDDGVTSRQSIISEKLRSGTSEGESDQNQTSGSKGLSPSLWSYAVTESQLTELSFPFYLAKIAL